MRTSLSNPLRILTRLFAPILDRFLGKTWSGRVQRLGTQALHRVAARFPAVAELIGMRVEAGQHQVAMGQSAPPQAARAPSATDGNMSLVRPSELFERLAEDPSWQVRAQAASEFIHLDGDGVIEALLRALEDSSAEVAAAAVDVLSQKRDPRVRPVLLKLLANDAGYYSPVTRAAAVQGLTRVLEAKQFGPVLKAIEDVDAEVSLAAIAALAERAPELAGTHLIPVLADRSGYFLPFVRMAAAKALLRTGTLPLHMARQLSQDEPDSGVRSVLESAATFVQRQSDAGTPC